MEIEFLGTGTSHGIPVVGCRCPVCVSSNPKNIRSRSSLLIRRGEKRMVIDTTPEFRLQAIRSGLDKLHAVFLTHAHADHVHGLDDIRPLSVRQAIPVFGERNVLDEVVERFSYIFKTTQRGGGKPQIKLRVLDGCSVNFHGMTIQPIPVFHGELKIIGYRFDNFAYITDCSYLPESSARMLEGVNILVLGALRFRPHSTHYTIQEALIAAEKVGASKTWLTHLCHEVDHDQLKKELPAHVQPAWDGLRIEV